MEIAFLLFTKIMFNNFSAWACTQIKFWTINRPITLGFSVFIYLIFRFTFFSSSFLFAAVFGLLPGFFRVEEFPTKRKRGKNYFPWTSKGWKGKFCSEFFTKILKRFGAYFKLQSNHAELGVVGKVLLCFTI